ncbi:SPOR domain-containing protein [Qipengyuania sp. DGS5-3]|uniref:SPOR domain-containing protein n=1 Tax=Qipengyuania sp. DGS5-3 TaxID=3349632 RepID=UPI0036D2B9C1
MSKPKTASNKRIIGLAVTTALASATLAGCTGKAAPQASYSSAQAEMAMAKGKTSKAVSHAEAAVLAAPRVAENRAVLGSTYMEAGRFASAATTYGEALELGDTSSRTIVSYALAQLASGDQRGALSTLDTYEAQLDPADFGLAVAMAGRPQQGVHVLGNALRSGQNTAKVRQNLAYAFALKGDWRSARLMVAQDLPADKVGDRLGQWATTSAPGLHHARVASLLGVPMVADSGQPIALALSNHPSVPMLAAENTVKPEAAKVPAAPKLAANGELPPVSEWASATPAKPAVKKPAAKPMKVAAEKPAPRVASKPAPKAAPKIAKAAVPTPKPTTAPKAAVKPAPVKTAKAPAKTVNGVKFASGEVVQKIPHTQLASTASPAKKPSSKPAAKPAPKMAKAESGNYRVQLGSYFSMSDAQAAWKVFLARHPELEGSQKVISKAKVKGKIYYRVAAGGYAKASAVSMCSKVKRGGAGCIAYAANNPLPGTIDNDVRVAAR